LGTLWRDIANCDDPSKRRDLTDWNQGFCPGLTFAAAARLGLGWSYKIPLRGCRTWNDATGFRTEFSAIFLR
jgi:hypothetical protein